MEILISTSELAERLDVHKITVQRMANDGRIPCIKISSTEYRFKYSDVMEALKLKKEG